MDEADRIIQKIGANAIAMYLQHLQRGLARASAELDNDIAEMAEGLNEVELEDFLNGYRQGIDASNSAFRRMLLDEAERIKKIAEAS